MNFYAITGLINALTSTILGIFVFLKNKKAKVNQVFAFLCCTIAAWSYGYVFWIVLGTTKSVALFWARILNIAAIFIPITYFYFTTVFLNIYEKKKKLIFIGYLFSFFISILGFTSLFVRDVEPELSFLWYPKPGITFHFFTLMFFSFVIYSWYLMFKAMKKATGIINAQIKYILTGTLIGFVGGSTNFLLIYDIPVPPFANGLVVVYVILIAYAIVRYRLMDISVAVGKVVTFLLSFLTVLFAAFLIIFIHSQLATPIGISQLFLLIFLFSFGVFYLHKFYENLAEMYFYPGFFKRKIILLNLQEELCGLIEIQPFSVLITNTLKKAFNLEKIAIFVKVVGNNDFKLIKNFGFQKNEIIGFLTDASLIKLLEVVKKPFGSQEISNLLRKERKKEELLMDIKDKIEKLEIEILIPLLFERKVVGVIVLGQKLSLDSFSKEEMQALSGFSDQTSVALRNTLLYSEVKKRKEELESFYRLTVDKEMQILELKKKIKKLEKEK